MANVTKEYFDKKFGVIDKKFEGIDKEIKGVKTLINEKFDDLNTRTANGFRDIQERLDVKVRVEKLERGYEKIKEALHLGA